MTRRRRAARIEPPRQRCINLNMEEEYEEEEGTVEDTEKRLEGRELLTTAMQDVQFSALCCPFSAEGKTAWSFPMPS